MPNINGVEIFSTGTWNGDKYTAKDLEEIVKNFEETKATVKPYLKLGHDSEQKFLQKEGIPSAGWIDRLYIQGEKLVADFADIPQKIYELIQKKAYRKVSSEMFWNVKIKEKSYRRLLSAVALLGAETPAVMNLSDILALYGLSEKENDMLEIKSYEYQEGIMAEDVNEKMVSLEKELEAQKQKASETEEQIKKFQADIDSLKKENDLLASYKKQTEEEKEKQQLEKEELERKNFILELEKNKLCSDAMKPFLHSLLSPEKKEYSIKQKDGKEKTYSRQDLVQETLKLFKAATEVNFEESSEETEKKDYAKSMDEKIKKFMEENKCSYKEAYKAVMKEQKPEPKKDEE